MEQPKPVQLPPTQTPHPSEPVKTTYQDPSAPEPKHKLRFGRAFILLLALGIFIAGAMFGYFKFIRKDSESSAISDYSGGLANDTVPQSEVTPETEAAKKFLQAVQAKDAAVVNELSSDELKQQVILETKDDSMSVLAFYQNKFEGIDFNSLISSVSESDASVKRVVFMDNGRSEGSTNTYSVELLVKDENGTLRITNVQINLNF